MLIRYQTNDGKNHSKEIKHAHLSTPASLKTWDAQAEYTGMQFLRGIGDQLRGATFYRDRKPFKSFAYTPEQGLHQTNP